jgi:hypothetical protein
MTNLATSLDAMEVMKVLMKESDAHFAIQPLGSRPLQRAFKSLILKRTPSSQTWRIMSTSRRS